MDKNDNRSTIMLALLAGGFDETEWVGEFTAEIKMIEAIRRYENIVERMEQEDAHNATTTNNQAEGE